MWSGLKLLAPALALGLAAMAGTAYADEYFVGAPVEKNGLSVSAAYVLGVTMEPQTPMAAGSGEGIHLEADIEAAADNRHGFAEGDWVPYLSITYTLRKKGTDWITSGSFLPMTAKDGPHYAAMVVLPGPGNYHVVYRIAPPIVNGFFRHTDEESGVAPWWPPFEVAWDFTFPSKRIEE